MRTRTSRRPVLPVLAVLLLLAGCGAEGDAPPGRASGGDVSGAAGDSQQARISDEALGSLERENLELRLAWTVGVVNRDPTEDAGAATLRGAAVEQVEGADRLLLTFDSVGGVPGYRVEGSLDPATDCETGEEIAMEGEAVLLVHLGNTTREEELGAPTDVADALRNVRAVRLTCDRDGAVEWALPVETATYYRVLEASSPPRLAVDVRHPGADSGDDEASGTP